MEITQSALALFFRQADLRFGQALTATKPWWSEVADLMPSGTRENVYGWLAKIPQMRKWVGPRVVNALATHAVTVRNEPWEDTIKVMEEDLRHDQYGIFNGALKFLAAATAKWPDVMLRDLIYNNTTAGYDNKYQFATDHPTLGGDVVGPDTSTQQNYWSSGMALTSDNYATVRAAMMSFKGEDGLPLGITPNVLMVPPALEQRGKLVLEAEFITGALTVTTATTSNPWYKSARLLVNPDLRSATDWFLLDTTKPVKPWIFQQEMAPRTTYIVDPTHPSVFNSREFIYGVQAWGNVAHSLWFLSARASA